MKCRAHAFLHLCQGPGRAGRVLGQPVLHLLLHMGHAGLDALHHLSLRIGLGIRHGLQTTAQLFLPHAKLLYMAAQYLHLSRQRCRHPRRPPRRTHRHHQQDQHQQDHAPAANQQQHGRACQRVGFTAKLDHVRPNRRSISLNFSST